MDGALIGSSAEQQHKRQSIWKRIQAPGPQNNHFVGGRGLTKHLAPHDRFAFNQTKRLRAAFVVLCRNSDLNGILSSMRQYEDRFNRNFNYPWVFLNDEPFTDEFKRKTSAVVSGGAKYAQIPAEHWDVPSWIDKDKMNAGMKKMEEDHVMYGGSLSYRKMCRFNSGFFYRQEVLKDYDYYWRVEPDVNFFCDVNYDPFLFMQTNGIKYGYTLAVSEFMATIPTLWPTVKEFRKKYPELLSPYTSTEWLSDDNGDTYNSCHFWSNFELGDLRFFRGEGYSKYFEYLDATGGFFYERWGDAPVHAIAVAGLFLTKEEVHWFTDMGYEHPGAQVCIRQPDKYAGSCSCNRADSSHFRGRYGQCSSEFVWRELAIHWND
ncbi:glycosyl transferase [Ramicandelaber brevisporus]|nr:glycosyl transferase [Ramicandelaber brevisporus]